MPPGADSRAPLAHRAVLLMAYGGPTSLDEVEGFLKDVRGGRETPPELVEEVKARYRAIGGGSPLLERTREQARALEERLGRDGGGGGWRVFVGMRHWTPYVREAVAEIAAGGFEELVALCLTPQESRMSVGAYFQALDEALAEVSAVACPAGQGPPYGRQPGVRGGALSPAPG
ncbi:MAG TPA: ferrochelatase, partial [Thermoanaerobaculia bacterium]|nr:ferrochelatase [Thermoanaerobaculia bacterium]